jgi:prepilin-type N-terminal cleavage/methylation domain-containing protein
MLKALKSKKAMSLVEVVVAMAISVILLTSVVYIFTLGLNIYNKASQTYDAHTLALFTQQKIEAEVSYAGSMQIDGAEPSAFAGSNNECLYVSNGRLADAVPNGAGGLKDQYVYLSGAYTGLNCSIKYNLSSSMVLDVTIAVYKGSVTNVLYTTHTDIMINNLDPGLGVQGIVDTTGGAGGAAVEFTIPSVSS